MELNTLKAELIKEILEAIHEEFASMNACATEKAKADDTASKAVNEEAEAKPAEEAKAEEAKAEAKPAEEAKTEEKVDKLVEEPAKEEEVIKIETLNSSPIPTLNSRRPAWKDMS